MYVDFWLTAKSKKSRDLFRLLRTGSKCLLCLQTSTTLIGNAASISLKDSMISQNPYKFKDAFSKYQGKFTYKEIKQKLKYLMKSDISCVQATKEYIRMYGNASATQVLNQQYIFIIIVPQ